MGVKNHKNMKYMSIVDVEADTTSFITIVALVIIFVAVAMILVHKNLLH